MDVDDNWVESVTMAASPLAAEWIGTYEHQKHENDDIRFTENTEEHDLP